MSQEVKASDWTSPLFLGASLLRGRWRVMRWVLVGGLIAGIVASLRPTRYAASASFIPQASDPAVSGLASLAGQFGISLTPGGQSQSPDFYRALLGSRVLLSPVAADSFVVEELNGRTVAFLDLFEIEDENDARRFEKGVDRLSEILRSSANNSTGLVELSVATEWPSVSLAIVSSLMAGVHDFNQRTRQGEAAAERKFVESRLAVVGSELRAAEDELEQFLATNRQFESSPELTFRHDRLQREVALREQVLTSLAQSYEEARIREVRNTPVISVVTPPTLPALPEPRRRILLGLAGMALGGLLGSLIVLVSASVARRKLDGDAAVDAWSQVAAEAKEDLRKPHRWVVQVFRA